MTNLQLVPIWEKAQSKNVNGFFSFFCHVKVAKYLLPADDAGFTNIISTEIKSREIIVFFTLQKRYSILRIAESYLSNGKKKDGWSCSSSKRRYK